MSRDVGMDSFDLGAEMRRLARLSARFGNRIAQWLDEHPEVMPDLECRETYRVYMNSMLGIAKYVAADRENVDQMSADELAKLRHATARAVVLEMDDVALKRLLAERENAGLRKS